jgi:threonine/homoserine/homoserine lactone efflux protein
MVTVDFLITSLIVVLIPGTGVIFTVSTGLIQGRGASVFAAIGCTLGIVPHLLATVFGLAALMHTSALAFEALKVAGVAYLLYLAYATWRDKAAFAVETSPSRGSALGLVVKAFLLNILNPKLTIFFLAFLPQFVDAEAPHKALAFLVLGLIFVGNGTLYCLALAAFAARASDRLRRSGTLLQWINRGLGALFVALGLRVALLQAR